MTGHRVFGELRQAMSPERRAQNAEATQAMLERLALHELRRARTRSQAELARNLQVGQPAVAEIEQRTDLYVGNLLRFVEALGGKLEITAHFPHGSVTITNFADIDLAEDRLPVTPRP